ncbi:hypothetical protein [Almyronema epifaneia]|uniref:Uncharacterized protein n=1 Tax=Almyronema epifaneia S1 TaxID=2991925 RepID=A0ABW6IIB3_9CYAN
MRVKSCRADWQNMEALSEYTIEENQTNSFQDEEKSEKYSIWNLKRFSIYGTPMPNEFYIALLAEVVPHYKHN